MSKYCLFLLIFSSLSCTGQSVKEGCKELSAKKSISLSEFIWKLDDRIYGFYDNDTSFHKFIILVEHDDKYNLEGEKVDHLYMLKGRYGEYFDGQLFDMGSFYNIQDITRDNNQYKVIFGALEDPEFLLINCD